MSSFSRSIGLSASLRHFRPRAHQSVAPARIQKRFATQGYGDGEGSPEGENPLDQGPNPSADKEHPGPPPPKAGEGSGSTPTKGSSEGHTKLDQTMGKTNQSRSFSTMRSLWGEEKKRESESEMKPKSAEGLKPAILDERVPEKGEQSEDVREHNRDVERRHDRANVQIGVEGEGKE